jgi:hypothetical protein
VIQSVDSDLLSGALTLKIELGFPAPSVPYSKIVELRFQGVKFALVYAWKAWSGTPTFEEYRDRSESERQAMIEESQARARVETVGIEEFADHFSQGAQSYPYDGAYATESDKTWITLVGIGSEQFASWTLKIVARNLSVIKDDGAEMSFEELLATGATGWTEFGSSEPTPLP